MYIFDINTNKIQSMSPAPYLMQIQQTYASHKVFVYVSLPRSQTHWPKNIERDVFLKWLSLPLYQLNDSRWADMKMRTENQRSTHSNQQQFHRWILFIHDTLNINTISVFISPPPLALPLMCPFAISSCYFEIDNLLNYYSHIIVLMYGRVLVLCAVHVLNIIIIYSLL